MSLVAKTLQIASAKDNNPVRTDMIFYGVIREIWILDYFSIQIPLFKCDWVDNKNGINIDELGFTSVDLDRVGHKSDSFILASQAKQVFYVPDQMNPKYSIVLSTPQRDYYDKDDEDDLNDGCLGDDICTIVLPTIESFDVVEESSETYMREDCEGTWIDNTPT